MEIARASSRRRPSVHRGHLALGALVLACLALAAGAPPPLSAQDAADEGRLVGRVMDLTGKPVAGARVSLVPDAEPEAVPLSATTNSKGRWSMLTIEPGRWRIRIQAEGFITSDGWVQVQAGGFSPTVEVRLRSLDEVSPSGFEGSPGTIVRWLEQGDSLLAQGRLAQARAEYEKALAVLPPSEQPKVLQGIARTYFLGGAIDEAAGALEKALRLAPTDPDLRQLYGVLREDQGRAAEAAAFFAELDAGRAAAPAAGAAAEAAGAGEMPPWLAARLEVPVEAARPGLLGHHRVSFGERSPLGRLEVFLERSGLARRDVEAVDPNAAGYDLAKETFQLYVPAAPPPEGYGLLVWVAPIGHGDYPRPETAEVLERRHLIWVGADRAGNPRPYWDRWGLALDAVANLERLYRIDPRRVYVAGYSGGGRVASALGTLYPEAFRGAFCWFGVDHFDALPLPDRPGTSWPVGFRKPPGSTLRQVARDSRFVLLTGERDFNRAETRAAYDHLLRDGFRHVDLLEIPAATHYFGIDPAWLERGLELLDAPLTAGGGR